MPPGVRGAARARIHPAVVPARPEPGHPGRAPGRRRRPRVAPAAALPRPWPPPCPAFGRRPAPPLAAAPPRPWPPPCPALGRRPAPPLAAALPRPWPPPCPALGRRPAPLLAAALPRPWPPPRPALGRRPAPPLAAALPRARTALRGAGGAGGRLSARAGAVEGVTGYPIDLLVAPAPAPSARARPQIAVEIAGPTRCFSTGGAPRPACPPPRAARRRRRRADGRGARGAGQGARWRRRWGARR